MAPNLAYQYESFVVNGVWDGTHLDRVDHSAIVSVVNGHVLDYARAWEAAEVAVGLTTPRAAFSVLVRSEPGVQDVTIHARVRDFDPERSNAHVLLSHSLRATFPETQTGPSRRPGIAFCGNLH